MQQTMSRRAPRARRHLSWPRVRWLLARRAAGTVVLAVALAVSAPAVARAHIPTLESPAPSDAVGSSVRPFPTAQHIAGPDVSRAVYGYLAPGHRIDVFEFTVPRRVRTRIDLLVPSRDGLDEFRPTLTLYAGGTARHTLIRDPGGVRHRAFEPFSLASFWQGARVTETLLPGVRYFLVVGRGTGDAASGSYVVAFGGEERFSPRDWRHSLAALPTIWLGSWGGGPIRPGAIALLGLLGGGVVVFAVRLLLRRRRATG